MTAEINEIGNRKTIENFSKTENWYIKKNNKIELANLQLELPKLEKTQITKITDEKRESLQSTEK